VVGDIAYADDLISVEANPINLQRKADMVCAWSLLTGVSLSVEKFRSFGVCWGPDLGRSNLIKIHGAGWKAEEIELKGDGVLKHLGVKWDMYMGGESQIKDLKEYIAKVGSKVIRSRVRMSDKMTVLLRAIYPKLLYVLQYGNWGLGVYKDVEREISKVLVAITKNLKGFPRALLYVRSEDGGLGVTSIVEAAQRRKIAELERGLETKGIVGLSFRCLLNRAARSGGSPLIKGRESIIRETLGESTWLSSVISWCAEAGCTVVMTGGRPVWSGNTNTDASGMDKGLREEMNRMGELLVGERAGKAADPDNYDGLLLRVGQCWDIGEAGAFYEVLGWTGGRVNCRRWVDKGSRWEVDSEGDRTHYNRGSLTGFWLDLNFSGRRPVPSLESPLTGLRVIKYAAGSDVGSLWKLGAVLVRRTEVALMLTGRR